MARHPVGEARSAESKDGGRGARDSDRNTVRAKESLIMACPKCGAARPSDEDDDSDVQQARSCGYEACPFVRCDDLACRALRDPQTLDELRAAVEHWRGHQFLGGCSHGC